MKTFEGRPMRASDFTKVASVAAIQAILLFLALSYWWRLSVLVNSAIGTTIPIYALLAFGILSLVGVGTALRPPALEPSRSNTEIAIAGVSMVVGIVGCFLTGTLCLLHSGTLAAPLTAPAELSGVAAAVAPLLLAVYIGLVEEIAFRGVFQRKLAKIVGGWRSVFASTALFLAVHIPNQGFSTFWPFYLCVSLVCGYLTAQVASLPAALFVHGCINLLGAVLPGPLNAWAEFLRRPVGLTLLSFGLALSAAIFCGCMAAYARSRGRR